MQQDVIMSTQGVMVSVLDSCREMLEEREVRHCVEHVWSMFGACTAHLDQRLDDRSWAGLPLLGEERADTALGHALTSLLQVTDELMAQCSKISQQLQRIFGAAGVCWRDNTWLRVLDAMRYMCLHAGLTCPVGQAWQLCRQLITGADRTCRSSGP